MEASKILSKLVIVGDFNAHMKEVGYNHKSILGRPSVFT